MNEKTRATLLEKLKEVEIEKNLLESESRVKKGGQIAITKIFKDENDGDITQSAEVSMVIDEQGKSETRVALIQSKKKIIKEKGTSKDWQEKDIALREMELLFKACHSPEESGEILEDEFVSTCLILLKGCLEENNMTLYLQAVQVSEFFFERALISEVVLGSLPDVIEPIILRTTDTNTRVRKKSVEILY